ncbi:MAG: LacI family DNA-binding transcriptional regulator [Clostridia bacterium]|nr:LacI family DNA-binding transcriptional regulator [Clostridia bacterium]
MVKRARVTIKDVAKRAGVTPQTVSRAFRDTSDISSSTRDKILQIAEQMGYVVNHTASALRRGNTKLIAVVFDNLVNVYFSIMSNYMQKYLKDFGYSMLTISTESSVLSKETYISAVSHNVAGIISFLEPKSEISSLIKSYNVPVLLFGRRTDVKNVYNIYTADETGGELAAKRLIQSGCKRLMFVTETLDLTCAYDRFSGFKKQTESEGLKTPKLIKYTYNGLKDELIALGESADVFPDGIFCFNDMIAFHVLQLIEMLGLPHVKVIGYDNVQNEVYLPTRLTSIATDKKQMAKSAVQIITAAALGKEIENPNICKDVFIVNGVTT